MYKKIKKSLLDFLSKNRSDKKLKLSFDIRLTFKVFLLLGILFIVLDCKKKQLEKEPIFDESYYKSMQGTWDVIPSTGKKIIFHEGKKATFFAGGNPIPLIIQMDTFGMRLNFTDGEKAFGYFVHSEKKDSVWMGILEDEVVRLSKVNPGNSSVLE